MSTKINNKKEAYENRVAYQGEGECLLGQEVLRFLLSWILNILKYLWHKNQVSYSSPEFIT